MVNILNRNWLILLFFGMFYDNGVLLIVVFGLIDVDVQVLFSVFLGKVDFVGVVFMVLLIGLMLMVGDDSNKFVMMFFVKIVFVNFIGVVLVIFDIWLEVVIYIQNDESVFVVLIIVVGNKVNLVDVYIKM